MRESENQLGWECLSFIGGFFLASRFGAYLVQK